ncbi:MULTISPECIES: MFS transporter [Streptomyces]|uniref:MFS transporter n=1 Tax=Streptomyces TaxID=1883 RepID=UPI002248B28C|nr:MFS transporter [Streptomyces sp. JHD 1]MCX2969310.1 MFS transporter [Streptomyces sp. JHD 1]
MSTVSAHDLRVPLRHRNFRNLAAGRLLMYFANAMAPIVLAFAVLDLTGSTTDLGLVVGTRSVANVTLLLLGGVIADRLSRTLVLEGSAVAACVAQGLIAVGVLLGHTSIPMLMVLSLINGAVSAMSLPASAALTPQTVPAELLRPANAVMRMGVNTGMIGGSSLGGVLVAAFGPGWGLACNAVAFLAAAVFFFGVRVDDSATERAETPHVLRELREGWREFTSRAWVWVVTLQFMVVNAAVAGGVLVLGPVVADETIGRSAWGFVLGAQMLGALVGGFVAARMRTRRALFLGVAVTAFDAVPLIVLAEAPHVALLSAAMFCNGVALEQFGVAWDLSLQQNIPQDRLARVYSYDALGSFVALPVGEVGAGLLAEHVGTHTTLLLAAGVVLVPTVAALAHPQVRHLTVKTPAAA